MKKASSEFQDIYIGLVRLHVLHHASQEPIFGSGIISELARHGYRLGPGTIYPLLRSMERRGWLAAESKVANGRRRIHYSATRAGKAALQVAGSVSANSSKKCLRDATSLPVWFGSLQAASKSVDNSRESWKPHLQRFDLGRTSR
jgi:DNA-binding PadR family transcriptional regulator